MKILGLLLRAASAALLCLIALAAAAADYPAPNEGDWIARDFRFHTGDVMPGRMRGGVCPGPSDRRKTVNWNSSSSLTCPSYEGMIA